ncbi:unnamed protein product [Sphenostylis stenocarpa]|uniref:Peptidase C14 caspase domain-containing protein n=1 Tax=Sphenostylis stenocarpa TaxID=92480 RepID=A0AA86VPF5_9FABA|nr:unnamed protein product [Sphenostylis stenocarpa]
MEAAYSMPFVCYSCQGQGPTTVPQNYYFANHNGYNASNYPPPPPPPAAYGCRTYNQCSYPQPLQLMTPPPPPPLTPPSSFGNKRAVIIGISYGHQTNSIKGSLNDAQCVKNFLISKAFPTDSMWILTDHPGERNPMRIPTRYNIRMAMRWLVEGCRSGDSLWFYYSGHGSQEEDTDMDELDGYDEAICPVDYVHEGKIIDDEINATIVRPLPHGAKLHALVDTCFSGTILDLPFMCRMNRKGHYGWQDHRNRRTYKGTRGGLAVCISACDDDGSAADTSAFSGVESTGALTFSFIQAMQNQSNLTYGNLLNSMRSTIRGAKERTFGPTDRQFSMNTRLQYVHEPQLSSSEMFEIYSKTIVI